MREAIIDAAEEVFARKGFYGASLREIGALAGVRSGLLHYYFQTKDALFETTVLRRIEDMKAIYDRHLLVANDTAGGHPSPADLCRAYVGFFFGLYWSEDRGWRSYITLLTQTAAAFDEDIVQRLLMNFNFVSDRMIAELSKALPWAPEETLRANLFYLECSVTTALLSTGLRKERMPSLAEPSNWQQLADDMSRFFARGMAVDTSRGAELASRGND